MKNKYVKILIIIISILIIFLLINFIKFKKINITLKGNSNITISTNDNWIDPGYNLVGIDKIEVINNLNTTKTGTYEIIYKAKYFIFTKKVIRTINVIQDNSPLKLTLKQDKIYLLLNNEYKEPGYEAFDINDGDITENVKVTNNIDNTKIGTYYVEYYISNSSGINKTVNREIIVYDMKYTIKKDETITNKNININITFNDDNYKYTKLPDDKNDSNKDIFFEVNQNGSYKFIIYDKYDNYKEEIIEVKNIDKTKPTGTCTYYLYNTSGEIKVDAKDDNDIKSYVYFYGNSKDTTGSNNYKINTLDDKASVNIIDNAGNELLINCNVVDKSDVIKRSYTLNHHTGGDSETSFDYWLYTPQNTVRTKIPLLLYFHGDGGKGSDPNLVNGFAYPKFVSNGMDFPFMIVAPQCHKGDLFLNRYYQTGVKKMLNELTSKYNIDTDRIIVAGGSSGADGAYRMASQNKGIFSCLVIGSGTFYEIDPANLTYLPIWVFHGKLDTAVSHTGVESRIEKIKEAGGNVKYTLVENEGHEVTETFFKNQELINWMISQKKK